jgi:hypothetical protein
MIYNPVAAATLAARPKIVSVSKGCFSALTVSIYVLIYDSDLWPSPYGQPAAVNFRVAKVCGGFKETPQHNPLIPCQDKKSPLSESENNCFSSVVSGWKRNR